MAASAAITCSRPSIRAGHRGFGLYSAATATTMLATTALASAGFSQSPRLVNLAGLFQRASIVTGFGWLTTLSAKALTRALPRQPANHQPESATPAFHRARRAAEADVRPEGRRCKNIQIDRLHVDHNLAANDAKSAK